MDECRKQVITPCREHKQALLIFNPVAGRKTFLRQFPQVIHSFMDAGYLVTTMVTSARGEAAELAARCADGYDLVVCAGGDGTLNEVISGLAARGCSIPVGYIPCGSTNDFAAARGLPTEIIPATRAILNGPIRSYDIGRFSDRYFSYVALFGAFSWMAYTTDQDLKNRIGYTAYLLDAAKDLNKNQPHHVKIITDGVIHEDDYVFGAVSNAKRLAGIIDLPESMVDTNDGRFEVFLVKAPKSILKWDTVLHSLVLRDFSNPLFELTQAEDIWIENEPGLDWSLDGERAAEMERIHIVPKHGFLKLKG